MESILENMYSRTTPSSSPKLAQAAVLLQPGMMGRLRKFVPTDANLKDAFYKLIKSSQAHYKPSSKYFLPVILENGLTVASLRYDEKTAEQVLGVRYLPLVSSQDRQLFKLLFLNAHTINAGPFSLHLNKSTTAARLRQGKFGVITAHSKKMIQPLIENCVKCIKTSKLPAKFDPPLGPPRFLNLLESSSPIFSGISFDIIGPLKFLLKRGARGAKTISKGYCLIAVCVINKYVSSLSI